MAQQPALRGISTITFYAEDLPAAQKWYSEFPGIDAYFAFPDSNFKPSPVKIA